MYGYVYITINKLNGKIYIGKKVSNRFRNFYYGSGKLIRQALKDYGKDSFIVEQLAIAETKEDLNYLEKLYIQLYGSFDPNIGYNMTLGGDGGNTILLLSDDERTNRAELIRKNSEGRIFINNGNCQKFIKLEELDNYLVMGYSVGILPSNIEKIRNATIEYHKQHPHKVNKTTFKKGYKPWNCGIPMKEETKRKLSEINKGRTRTEESCRKQSETLKRKYASGERVSAQKGVPACNKGQKGVFHWYTNGIIDILLRFDQTVPENFYPGRHKRSN